MVTAQQDLSYANKKHDTEDKSPVNSLTVFNFSGFSYDYELKNITSDMAGEHPFGDVIAKKDYLLAKKYTSEEVLNPGNPQTITVIQKPEIYKAVQRIEKYLKKSVKKGEVSNESATYTYNKVLDVAISILTLNTSSFETALKTANTDSERIELFTKRVNLIY